MQVVQEVALAQSCVVLCGTSSASWKDLSFAAGQLWRVGPSHGTFRVTSMSLSVSPVVAIDLAHKELQYADLQSPLSLLSRYRVSKATDPRDHIFALFGLRPDGFGDLGLQPSYDLDIRSLYIQAAMSILEKSQNLDLFSVPRFAQQTPSNAGPLPCWVPDWSQHAAVNSLLGLEFPCARPTSTTLMSKWQPVYRKDGLQLLLEGYRVDEITKSILVKSEVDDQPADMATHGILYRDKRLRALDRILKTTSKRPHVTDDPMMVVAMVTLCGGIYEDGYAMAERRYHKHRQTRRLPSWLSILCRIAFPTLYRILHAQRLAWLDRFMLKQVGALDVNEQGETSLWPDVEFSTYDRSFGRQLFRTKGGYVGLGPPLAKVGDQIYLCKGGRLPLVLRRRGGGGSWELMGDCYIAGMVKGELWDEGKCGPVWIA